MRSHPAHGAPGQQCAFRFAERRGHDFEYFLTGPNGQALVALRRVVASGGALYLWGGPGTGKTHLLTAAADEAQRAGRTAIRIGIGEVGSPEDVSGDELVCVDDLQCGAGRLDREKALFLLYEKIREVGGSLLMAANVSARTLPIAREDLGSRLVWGLSYRLLELADDDKVHALQLRARSRSLDLPGETARYLLNRFPRDMHTLFALLDRIDSGSLAAQRRLTLPFVREYLSIAAGGG